MRVYFVRHGESTANFANKHEEVPGMAPLTEAGKAQAHKVGKRLVGKDIEVIIASPYVRAKDTAAIISEEMGAPVEINPLIHERLRPSILSGMLYDDADAQTIQTEIRAHWGEDWHHSDEESFVDVGKRIRMFLNELINRKEQVVVIIAHDILLRRMMSIMIFGDELTGTLDEKIYRFLQIRNTGITLCEYSEEYKWRMISWNDHAHLD